MKKAGFRQRTEGTGSGFQAAHDQAMASGTLKQNQQESEKHHLFLAATTGTRQKTGNFTAAPQENPEDRRFRWLWYSVLAGAASAWLYKATIPAFANTGGVGAETTTETAL